MLEVFGFAFVHLNRNRPFLRYPNEAVLPIYILHQSVILPLAFFAVQWAIPDLLKFLFILVVSFGIVVVLYELLVRRFNLLRFLFDMKLAFKVPRIQAQESQGIEPAGTP